LIYNNEKVDSDKQAECADCQPRVHKCQIFDVGAFELPNFAIKAQKEASHDCFIKSVTIHALIAQKAIQKNVKCWQIFERIIKKIAYLCA
jgi:hypothetical protein